MLVDFSFIFMGFIFIFLKLYMCRVVVCGEWWMGWWCLLIMAWWWWCGVVWLFVVSGGVMGGGWVCDFSGVFLLWHGGGVVVGNFNGWVDLGLAGGW